MEEYECQSFVKEATDTSRNTPSSHRDVADPEEDDLDDLDGMI